MWEAEAFLERLVDVGWLELMATGDDSRARDISNPRPFL
jgi:hypothetical protein